ncbi:MAG: peptidoglycan DD-metalloendopeptidase family protein [Clostridiaceae bacterium]|nr:peptidoglycan DD-metalloendopeptidase family protein [Clostridiaceae bacterium]
MKRLTIITLLVAILIASFIPVNPVMAGNELDKAQSAKSSTDNRINDLKRKQEQARREATALENEQRQIASEQASETNAYEQLLTEISSAEENLRQTEKALEEAIRIYNQQNELVKVRLKVMYQNSSLSMFDTLIESKSLVELFERLHYMSVVSENDNKMMEDLETARQDVEYKKELEQKARELLKQKAADKEKRLTQLKTSRAAVEGELAATKTEINKLEKEIDAQIAESKRLQAVIKNLSSKKKYVGGTMQWPCPSSYNVTSHYGTRKHPILRKYKMHTGIDIGASKGSSIVAANKGTVIMAKYDKSGGYGNMVVLDHGAGITTLYAHASKLCVKVGDEVKAGAVIAKVGSTGLSTGNHLHFEVRVNGETKNPLSTAYLGKKN